MERLHSYPKVYNLGHPAVEDLFLDPVVAQEKVDGSQFSFGRIGDELLMRSKGATVYPETSDKNFRGAVLHVLDLFEQGRLNNGWVYRGEVLSKPKHNSLAYDRIPQNHIILFDIDTTGMETYLPHEQVFENGKLLGLETVPLLAADLDWTPELIAEAMQRESVLGGQLIEGIVFKNYKRFTIDAKTMMGKHVSEAFKEVHRESWKKSNPGRQDIVEGLIAGLKTTARWNKAVQHLREAGTLEQSPRDIGNLIKEVQADTLSEEAEEIRDALFKHFWPQIQRGITGGLPEWYKGLLMEAQFNDALEQEVVAE